MLASFFFFNDTATTEIYTLSLHDALPIFRQLRRHGAGAHIELHLRLLPEGIPGAFEGHRPATPARQLLERARDQTRRFARVTDARRPLGESAQYRQLVGKLVQDAVAPADLVREDFGGQTQDRCVRRIGGTQRRRRVEHSGTGHAGIGPHAPARAGVAVGHVGRPLLMARAEVSDLPLPLGQRIDQAVGMYPGDAEDVPHAVADETIDDRLPGGYDFPHRAMLTVPRSRSDGCLTRLHVTPSA